MTLHLRHKSWLERNGRMAFGEGLSELLHRVEESGSIARAASAMGLAYREAWGRLRAAEAVLGTPLLVRHAGGRGGGGASLTPAATQLLASFRAIEAEIAQLAADLEERWLRQLPF